MRNGKAEAAAYQCKTRNVNSISPALVMCTSEYTKPFCFSTRLRMVFSWILKLGRCEWCRSKPHFTDFNSGCFPCLVASEIRDRYHCVASGKDRALVGTNSSGIGVGKQARSCFGGPWLLSDMSACFSSNALNSTRWTGTISILFTHCFYGWGKILSSRIPVLSP